MANDLGTVRTALQSRLNAALTGVRAYDVTTGEEVERLGDRVVIQIFPRPWDSSVSKTGSGFYPTIENKILRYNFGVRVWVGLGAGLDRAQDKLDTFISPAGTHANSIEEALEDRDGDQAGDSLASLLGQIVVGQFEDYDLGALNSDEVNAITAIMPVEVQVDNS